ncbi:MAG: type II secretion system F family protein [Candidatus Gracilibacteria bacterium]|nr:type II secretion system F family protein [Candidatus Gracilibacteria bacterium]
MSDLLILENESKEISDGLKDSGYKPGLFERLNEKLVSSQGIKTSEKVVIFRLLATMVDAGLSLMKAISILEKQEKNPVVKNILSRFSDELKSGKTLSYCMSLFPSSFGDSETGMIESGEKTGRLNIALINLADQIEKIASINGKIKSALMYPAMIIVVVIGVIFVMMTMVVPKLLDIFEDKSKLPASTQLLMSISNAFTSYWWLMMILAVGGTIFVGIWKRTEVGKYKYDLFMLKLPVFGDIIVKMILSKFARTLSGLLSSGVSIVEALRITSDAVGNEVYKQRIMLIRDDIRQGLKIFESMEGDKLFPDMMVQMIQVGEQTAKLDIIIIKIADFYDEQVDNKVAVINKLLEPIIIVTLAVIVGFIAIAIMQPIMNLADTVSNS